MKADVGWTGAAAGDPNNTMPDVNGKDSKAVQSDLEARGLKVKVEKQQPSDPSLPSGTVISSNPRQGEQITGKEVTLYVAK